MLNTAVVELMPADLSAPANLAQLTSAPEARRRVQVSYTLTLAGTQAERFIAQTREFFSFCQWRFCHRLWHSKPVTRLKLPAFQCKDYLTLVLDHLIKYYLTQPGVTLASATGSPTENTSARQGASCQHSFHMLRGGMGARAQPASCSSLRQQ